MNDDDDNGGYLPANMAIPTITLGCVIPRVWTLYMDSMNVVDANEKSPLIFVVDGDR